MYERKSFGKYRIVNKIVKKNSFSAYVCVDTTISSNDLFIVNVYTDNKTNKIISKYFEELKIKRFNDYIECFNDGDTLCSVFRYNQEISAQKHLLESSLSPKHRKEYILDIVKLIISLSEMMSETLLNKLIRYENLYYDKSTNTFGFYYIFDFSDGLIYAHFSDIVNRTGIIIENLFYGCKINSKPFIKYIKKLKSRKYLTPKELLKSTVKAVGALDSKNAFDEIQTEKMGLFLKYKDILEEYLPKDFKNEKNKFSLILLFVFIIIIGCLAYICFFPNKMFFNINNQVIMDWFNNKYEVVYNWLSEL